MNEAERKQITDANDDHVREWFEASGFKSKKLDTKGSNNPRRCDWLFTKRDITILCEVKTIFSGGQSGWTKDQSERRRIERKRKFDQSKAEAIADGIPLLTHKDEQDYLEGKIPYRKQPIRKEEEFNNFQNDIRNELMQDQIVNQLPFSLTISIDGMYVVYGEERKQFLKWLKDYILWARQQPEHIYSNYTFTFKPAFRAEDGKLNHRVEAFVQMWGPYSYPQLQVGFMYYGVPYNETRIAEEIEEAVFQLRASIAEATTSTKLPTIALWSASDYLHFTILLMSDATEVQLGNISERYYMIDWAFLEYPELAAIILFQLHRTGDFWNPSPNDKIFPVGYIIPNPHLPKAEEILKDALINNCIFIPGIAADPLGDSKS